MAYSIRFSPPLTPTRSTHLRLLPLEALRPSEIPNRERDCDELRRQSTRASRTKTTVRENSESKWSTLCDVILTNTLVEDYACQYLSLSHISCCTLNVTHLAAPRTMRPPGDAIWACADNILRGVLLGEAPPQPVDPPGDDATCPRLGGRLLCDPPTERRARPPLMGADTQGIENAPKKHSRVQR